MTRINMRDGSLICVGEGNPQWNYSAPDGAGRLFSRGVARRMFTVESFANEMEGIYTTSVGQDTLDECPWHISPLTLSSTTSGLQLISLKLSVPFITSRQASDLP